NRRQLVESSDAVLNDAARSSRERESGQSTLFGDTAESTPELRLAPVADWLPHERLTEEFHAIGFYLSGHPLDGFHAALKRLGAMSYTELLEDRRRSGVRVTLGGTVIRKQERRGRSDQPYAFLALSDPTDMFEVMVFAEALNAARPLLEAGKSVLISV